MCDVAKLLAAADSVTASRTLSRDLLELHRPQACRHIVQFYENDRFIIDNVSFLAATSLRNGNSSLLIATGPHLNHIEERLSSSGFHLGEFRDCERYLALDAAETLSQFLVDDWPDETKFNKIVGEVLRQAAGKSANGFVFAFGEMVALLCSANRVSAAVRLEQLWNNLARSYRFSLCCAYPLSSISGQSNTDAIFQICAEHSFTIPAEGPA
jgi:hypothetical protein